MRNYPSFFIGFTATFVGTFRIKIMSVTTIFTISFHESCQEHIRIMRKFGFNPTAYCSTGGEPSYVFATDKEAEEAYELLDVELRLMVAYFYGPQMFKECFEWYQDEKMPITDIRVYPVTI